MLASSQVSNFFHFHVLFWAKPKQFLCVKDSSCFSESLPSLQSLRWKHSFMEDFGLCNTQLFKQYPSKPFISHPSPPQKKPLKTNKQIIKHVFQEMLHFLELARSNRTLLSFTICSTVYLYEQFHFSACCWGACAFSFKILCMCWKS